MDTFQKAYKQLNARQRQAVDQIDGPVMVLAGPGTGKTQLLSARVAHILQQTDMLAQNILCLTFTESGAANMRARLSQFIGQAAYDVEISTYHAFGGSLINRFPEYFGLTRLQEAADELTQHQLIQAIIEGLSYRDPLKQTRHHLRDVLSTISEVKRALLSADDIRTIAAENTRFLETVNPAISETLAGLRSMSAKHTVVLPLFEHLHDILATYAANSKTKTHVSSLAILAADELEQALEASREIGKNKPLTAWKDAWLVKDSHDLFVLGGLLETRRLRSLASVLETYQQRLTERGLYDFDDMILRSIHALETNDDLRFTLQERYQYILLDEFQDTNAAQFRLVELLTNNPVNEGRPNVLAVGDDDQAIYAFQGAQYSNMLDFYHAYRNTALINLDQNYRSHQAIIQTAGAIAGQIEARLQDRLPNIHKVLQAALVPLEAPVTIARQEYLSDVAQYHAIAEQIAELIRQGTAPSEIAVLAPKHRYLEPLVAYLNQQDIPLRYEKREDILEAPVIRQLLTMARLVLSLSDGNEALSASLWPEVLSYEFWGIPTEDIWQISWQLNDNGYDKNWTKALLGHPTLKPIALLCMTLAGQTTTKTCEEILDALIGTVAVRPTPTDMAHTVSSPLQAYYTSPTMQESHPGIFYDTLSHLTVLRTKLREYQAARSDTLLLADLMELVELYRSSETRMLNTSPYNQKANAVQLMTVYKAKGLEFEHVFLPCVHDDVWGETSRSGSNRLTLPKNLAPIRHSGASQDERLRAFFVAITRAKHGLHLFSYRQTYSGKTTKRLKYLDEQDQPDGSVKALMLPPAYQTIQRSDSEQPPTPSSLSVHWSDRHTDLHGKPALRELLKHRLDAYQLSPTHLNSFTDMEYGGPEAFFFNTLLRFPSAPSTDGQFGNAIHETLEWLQHEARKKQLSTKQITQAALREFASRLRTKHLPPGEFVLQQERGEHALTAHLAERHALFTQEGTRAEYNFKNEAVFIGKAHLSGKVDRMEIDEKNRTIVVVDYKTGRPHSKWESTLKLHKYRTQLYCYKILIENSRTFKGYTVTGGRLEFIEPDADGGIHSLICDFKPTEEVRIKALIQSVWQHIMALDFPEVSTYPLTLAGTKAFEADLVAEDS